MPDASALTPGTLRKGSEKKVAPCNFRQTGQLTSQQVRSVSALNETFARNLARALAAYLRVSLECTLATVEQAPYRDVLTRIPPLAYVATFAAAGDCNCGLIQIDPAIAFPMIDLLLGGEGKPEARLRELTEIEGQVLESVVRILCHELAPAWQPLGVAFEFHEQQPPANLNKLMAPEERTLTAGFEIAIPEVKGSIHLIFPGRLSNALLRRLAHDWEYQRPQPAGGNGRMRELVLECPFTFELSLADLAVPAAELAGIAPGTVLPLGRNIQAPPTANVGGIPMFTATAARSETRRAAQIVCTL